MKVWIIFFFLEKLFALLTKSEEPDGEYDDAYDDGDDEYSDRAAEKILKKRTIKGKNVEYLVKWRGLPESKATWESGITLGMISLFSWKKAKLNTKII